MRRAFTLVEILVTMAIIALVVAIAYPALVSAKEAAQRTQSTSNRRQLYSALAIYRTGYEGIEFGDAAQMGLPPDLRNLALTEGLPHALFYSGCPSIAAPVLAVPLFHRMWHEPSATQQPWEPYVEKYGASAVLLADQNCDFDVVNHSNPFFAHRGIGLYADGHVRVVVRTGFMSELEWWNTPADLPGG
ncbi:MAG: type II secretion system protein [Fimbriimonadaceae bacterium]